MMSKKERAVLIRDRSRQFKRPDGSPYSALMLSDAQFIARKAHTPLLDIETEALKADIVPERYSRNQRTLNCLDQMKLLQSRIAIVGLGGLGGAVTEVMARIGIGEISLIDGDVFDESNLNRQLLCSIANLGKSKALEAAKRVKQLNPAVRTVAVKEFFTVENSTGLLKNVDLAIDCLDTITDRFILELACRKMSIPLISAAIGGTGGQATVIYPEDTGLKSIYGTACKKKKGVEATLGTLPFTALYMAAVECAEATTLLLGKKPTLKNKLFIADVTDHSTETFQLTAINGK